MFPGVGVRPGSQRLRQDHRGARRRSRWPRTASASSRSLSRTANGRRWSDSKYNRRITAATPMTPRRPGRWARPPEDQGRPERAQLAGHAQQLRRRADAVGHLPDGRGELQRLLLDRPEGRRRQAPHQGPRRRAAEELRALRHSQQLVQLGQVPRALQRRQGSQRVQPLPLGRRDRSHRSRLDAGQAHRARPLPARRRRDDRQQGRPRGRLLAATMRSSTTSTASCPRRHTGRATRRTTCACCRRARCRWPASTRMAA